MKSFLFYSIVTFFGLFLGGLFTNPGTSSEWYTSLSLAPWTPPGWVFGFAWTLIGVTWSVWAAKMCDIERYTAWYWVIWILNLVWNPVFFALHHAAVAGVVIFVLLLYVTMSMLETYRDRGVTAAIWALPYVLWLVVANSLNWYVVFAN